MSNYATPAFERPSATRLRARLTEPRRLIQFVVGPRQVGKTTLVQQVVSGSVTPSLYASADEPALRDTAWLSAQWEKARQVAAESGNAGAILVIDEVQKVAGWSETVTRLWDEDTRTGAPLRAVLLGSAPDATGAHRKPRRAVRADPSGTFGR